MDEACIQVRVRREVAAQLDQLADRLSRRIRQRPWFDTSGKAGGRPAKSDVIAELIAAYEREAERKRRYDKSRRKTGPAAAPAPEEVARWEAEGGRAGQQES